MRLRFLFAILFAVFALTVFCSPSPAADAPKVKLFVETKEPALAAPLPAACCPRTPVRSRLHNRHHCPVKRLVHIASCVGAATACIRH